MNVARAARATLAVSLNERRVTQYDWKAISNELSEFGCAKMEQLITLEECRQTVEVYSREERFRSHVHMARHGFGKGEYRYFKYPLPDLIGGASHCALSVPR
jgi:hypothetical protein